MLFIPLQKNKRLSLGLGLCAALLVIEALCVAATLALTPSAVTIIFLLVIVVSAPTLAWLGYRCARLARARYTLNRNALTVEWGGRREVVPLDQIDEAHSAAEFEGELAPRGLTWPDVVSRLDHPTLGAVEFLATTADKAALVLIGYPGGWLALSPENRPAFLTAVAERKAEGVAMAVEPESRSSGWAEWALWRDRLAVGLIAVGGLALFALVAFILFRYPELPDVMALRFDGQGAPERFGPPSGLFLLPSIGALAWGVNTLSGVFLHRREAERPAAYLLFSATLFIQALLWAALIGLLTAGRTA